MVTDYAYDANLCPFTSFIKKYKVLTDEIDVIAWQIQSLFVAEVEHASKEGRRISRSAKNFLRELQD